MLRIIIGVFLVLHGLVHLLYCGQSQRMFELQAGMLWPDGSWAFSGMLGDVRARVLATFLLALAAIAFVAGGAGPGGQPAQARGRVPARLLRADRRGPDGLPVPPGRRGAAPCR